MFPDGLPAGLAMTTLGALTAVLYLHVGLLALGLFALVAVLPQSALTFVARTRPVTQLDPLTATRRYAHAICIQLGLAGDERRLVDDVVRTAHARRVSGDPGRAPRAHRRGLERGVVRRRATSRSGGTAPAGRRACPAGSSRGRRGSPPSPRPGRRSPRTGSPRLGHLQALSHLESAAGVRLDPAVVHAVAAVIGQERASADVPAPEPRMHRLRRAGAACAGARSPGRSLDDRRRAVLAPGAARERGQRVDAVRVEPARARLVAHPGERAARRSCATRYGRLETIESKTSATAISRAGSGRSSAARPRG